MTTKLKSLPVIVFLLSLLALQSFGQQKTVSGKVVDNQGAAIAGATVTAKGTNVATQTNAEGSFSLNAPAGASRIVITAVGYGTLDIAIGSGAMNIVLQQAQSNLNEVVVVGYGTQRKRELTSAITSVSAEQFNKGNVPNVAQLLQGKVAGLSITRAGSNPNRGFDIRLRGISTIGANTQPLVVVDGQVGADLNTIDPNDIANIDVLKDGSSAAIYGTRGSAGVIIITTKKGTLNQSRVSYNSGVTIDAPFRFLPSMNADEFRAQIKLTGIGTDYGASTDWNKEITRNALSHFHNVSFSGGTAKTTYLLSLNYRNTEGVAIRTGFNQMNGRGNITHKALNDKLVLSMDLSATRKSSDLGFEKAFQYASIYNPTSPIYAAKPEQDLAGGGYFEVSATEYSNPYAMLVQNTNHSDFKRTNLTGTAEYEVIKGLKILGRFAQQYSNNYLSAYTPSNAFIDRGFYNGVTGVARRGYSYKSSDEYLNNLYESTVSYARKFNKLDFSGVAGYSYQDFLNQGYALGAGDFVSDLSGQNFATAQDFNNARASASSYKNASRLIAFFGRVTLITITGHSFRLH